MNQLLNIIKSREFHIFVCIGIFVALFSLALLYILVDLIIVPYLFSTIIVFIVANLIGFSLNKYRNFKTSGKFVWQEMKRYYIVVASNALLVAGCMYILVDFLQVWYIYASIIIAVVFAFYNFFLHKNWSFSIEKHLDQ